MKDAFNNMFFSLFKKMILKENKKTKNKIILTEQRSRAELVLISFEDTHNLTHKQVFHQSLKNTVF